MIIDEFNIEAYLLDFSEGTLNKEEQQEILNFLREHRDINLHPYEELPTLQILPSPNYQNKVDLYSSAMERINEREENQIIGYLHGDLDIDDREELERNLKGNYETRKKLDLYKESILSPDLDIVYPNLRDLKRKSVGKKVFPILKWAALACLVGVLLFFAPQIVGFFSNLGNKELPTYEARNEKPVVFTDSEIEQVQERERRNSQFVLMLDPNYKPVIIKKEEPAAKPEIEESSKITSPQKNNAVNQPVTVITKPAAQKQSIPKPKPTASVRKEVTPTKKAPTPYRPKKYKVLEPINSLDVNLPQEETYNYIALPAVEIQGIDNSDKSKENKELPANRAIRNTVLEALDGVGGKRVKYVKRKDGSYKLMMELPFFSIERTIQE